MESLSFNSWLVEWFTLGKETPKALHLRLLSSNLCWWRQLLLSENVCTSLGKDSRYIHQCCYISVTSTNLYLISHCQLQCLCACLQHTSAVAFLCVAVPLKDSEACTAYSDMNNIVSKLIQLVSILRSCSQNAMLQIGGRGAAACPPCPIDSCDNFPFCLLREALSNQRSQQGDHFIVLDRSRKVRGSIF